VDHVAADIAGAAGDQDRHSFGSRSSVAAIASLAGVNMRLALPAASYHAPIRGGGPAAIALRVAVNTCSTAMPRMHR